MNKLCLAALLWLVALSAFAQHADEARRLNAFFAQEWERGLQESPEGASGQRRKSGPPPTGSKRITSAPSCTNVSPHSGAAMNEDGGAENQIEEKNLSKAEIVAALKKSTEYCNRAYAQSDADAQKATRLFGQEQTRFFALTLNATHNGEHYGNMVTYMRINGMVPPSSRPRQ